MSTPSPRGLSPVPPDYGSFPLDHFSECQSKMTEYLKCLTNEKGKSSKCQKQQEEYLQCRIDKGLMAPSPQ